MALEKADHQQHRRGGCRGGRGRGTHHGPGRCVRLRAEPVAEGRVTVRTFKAESGVLTNGRG